MKYLLIVFLIGMVLPSGLVEVLARATRHEAVRYFLTFSASEGGAINRRPDSRRVLKDHRRGWDSPRPNWKWVRGEASANLFPQIDEAIKQLPEEVYGIRAKPSGVAFFLSESGDEPGVDQVAESLKTLGRK